jgi:hypothetical protein
MKRLLKVALSLGLAAAASLAFASTSGAQAEEDDDSIPATMQLSPEVAAPGQEVTAESVGPCHPEGMVQWEVIQLGGGDLPVLEGDTQADTDGHWAVVFAAPDDDEALDDPAAEYRFKAVCTMGDSPPYTYFADFRVEADGSEEPDPEPGSPAPASPVQSQPNFTG